MNLSDFNLKNLGKELLENNVLSNLVSNFINELKNYLDENKNTNIINNQENKYADYWTYENIMEDGVAATIGLSRSGAEMTYRKELNKAIEESILELSEQEGTLYRKKYPPNGSMTGDQFYNVNKFENGNITNITIPKSKIPEAFESEDIIFQQDKKGNIKVRADLRENIVNLASEKVKHLREIEEKRNNEFKKEGHIYKAFELDGCIFLKDLTEGSKTTIEDIDFTASSFEGEGKYQVINGKYEKISD